MLRTVSLSARSIFSDVGKMESSEHLQLRFDFRVSVSSRLIFRLR